MSTLAITDRGHARCLNISLVCLSDPRMDMELVARGVAAAAAAAPSLGLGELLFAGWAVCHELGRRWATRVFGSEDVGGAPRWRSFVGLGTSAGALPLLVCHTGFEPQPSRLMADLPLTRARPASHSSARRSRARVVTRRGWPSRPRLP